MKHTQSELNDIECSCLQIEVVVEEAWINQFLNKQKLTIPVTKKYNLVNPLVELESGKLSLQADILEKENSAIKITCLPTWNVDEQKIQLEEIDIKLLSKNILLQSAGWFAKTFMGGKIDKKIEEAANQQYTAQIQKLIEEGLQLPVQKDGIAQVQVKSITISALAFLDHQVGVKAMIEGYWKLHLGQSKPQANPV